MAHRVMLRLHDHKVLGSNPAWDFLSGSVRTAVSRLRGKANPCAWFQVQDPSEHMSQPLHNRTVVMHPFVPVFRHLYWHFCIIHIYPFCLLTKLGEKPSPSLFQLHSYQFSSGVKSAAGEDYGGDRIPNLLLPF